MQRVAKISRSFFQLSDSKFNDLGNGVINSLTENKYFPDIAPDLDAFKNAFEKYFNSIPHRNIRNSVNVAVKNANKEAAIKSLYELSLIVAYHAKFEVEALESSGFQLVNPPQSKGLVGMAKEIQLKTNGIEGLVIVQCDKDENATVYRVRVSTDQENWLWTNASSSRTLKVHNLPKGVPLYIQMQIGNSQGYSPWSESVSGMISTKKVIPSIHE